MKKIKAFMEGFKTLNNIIDLYREGYSTSDIVDMWNLNEEDETRLFEIKKTLVRMGTI